VFLFPNLQSSGGSFLGESKEGFHTIKDKVYPNGFHFDDGGGGKSQEYPAFFINYKTGFEPVLPCDEMQPALVRLQY